MTLHLAYNDCTCGRCNQWVHENEDILDDLIDDLAYTLQRKKQAIPHDFTSMMTSLYHEDIGSFADECNTIFGDNNHACFDENSCPACKQEKLEPVRHYLKAVR